MILKNLPEIGLQTGSGATLTGAYAGLSDYQVYGAVFAVGDKAVTVKVKAKAGENGTPETVRFRYRKTTDGEWTDADKEGVEITAEGQYLAVVTASSLSGTEYDRAAIDLTVADGGTVGTIALFRAQPRYTE